MGGAGHGVKSLFLLIFRGSGFGQLTGPRERDVARARRMGGRAEKLSTRDREFTYVDSTNNVCPLPWQKVAAATKNRADFIRLSVKKRAPLGEILPKNQGLSPMVKIRRFDQNARESKPQLHHNLLNFYPSWLS